MFPTAIKANNGMERLKTKQMVARLARLADRLLQPVVDPRRVVTTIREMPWFVRSFLAYARASQTPLRILDLYPQLGDRRAMAGVATGDYFHQDLWAARKVFQSGVRHHFDIGSRVDGFAAHCAVFTHITYVDARPLPTGIENMDSRIGLLGQLPFDDRSIASLSCLHVIEHVGLGRYGDPIDPKGTLMAMTDLQRILAPEGNLYLGLPIGKERVCFNAHRITDPNTVLSTLNELELVDFAVVDEQGRLNENCRPEAYRGIEYGCGLFHFRRP